ncbi:hypothetical protein N3740_001121 [Salmonella enterica subsp. enterica serovar Newport]|nr:hypothetical protein [Salmonella enterica subsp. enterica serovar Newport]
MARGTKKTDAGEATNESGVTLPENTASSDTGSGVVLPEITGSAELSTTDTAVTETRGADDVMVQPVRYFTDSATGVFRTPSDEAFSVNRRRMAELYENGLVREVKPQPDNKMRPDPQTKE